jgi:polyribonucleotide nucleotidyltransferase
MHKREINLGGSTLSIETGRLARQASGSVIVRYGDTVVLVTACYAKSEREGIDFLPLTVDYREYAYASGRIPGGFFKREGKATEKEVLTSRCIDRPLRPLFPSGWHHETQVIALALSADENFDPDVVAITGASAALAFSAIPFQKTLAGVRVGYIDGAFVINPSYAQRKVSALDIVVAGSTDGLVMVEAGANEVGEDVIVQALEAGHAAIKSIVAVIDGMAAQIGKKKVQVVEKAADPALVGEVESKMYAPLAEAMRIKDKLENYDQVDELIAGYLSSFTEEEAEKKSAAKRAIKELKEKVLRDEILDRGQRLDGRAFDEIRPIWAQVGVVPRTHGSAVFTRGETQALVSTTLGTSDDQQKIEKVDGEFYKRFMLHYNFPPFSVGEVAFMRGPGRREIGHGALAERALAPMMPAEEQFPYTVRVVSDILESNGSSSMASVCGGSLSMMDAGVPMKAPVAGIAMGLVMNEQTGKYAVLTDIAGAEDHYGDMDFKVAGTRDGVTALQMDIKVTGVTAEVLQKALAQARRGRLQILDTMAATLAESRADVSTYAPRIVTIKIPVDKIRDVIGPGGKMIRSIIERTGVKIDVEDDGRVNVASADETSAKKAIAIIMELTATAELNKTYMGKVQRITDFGAFVEIIPGTDGLLHVSEIARHRVQDVRDEMNEGDQFLVKVISIDPSGKIRLSRKALLAEEEGGEPGAGEAGGGEAPQDSAGRAPRPPRPQGHDRGPGGRGGRPGGPGGRDRRR